MKKNKGKKLYSRRSRTTKKETQNPFALIMIGYYPTTCDDIPNHSCDPCEAREFGRVRSAGFINQDFVFPNNDPTNAASWQAGIASGDIIIAPFTNGDIADPSPKTGPGYGDVVEEVLSYDQSGMFNDPNFVSNNKSGFYNALVGRRNMLFFFRTSSQTYITDVPVTITPKYKVDNDLTSNVVWNVAVKWQSIAMPVAFNTPDGIFEDCFEQGE
jgi:hypothetical protein